MKKLLLLTLFVISLGTKSYAQGDLLIAPLRVVFEGNKQKEEIGLTNIGKDTAFYVVSFTQYDMLEDGSFKQLSDTTQGRLFASPYVRIFPRRVVLAPGESQTVRLQLRKRQDMETGEYRSHLYFRSDNEKRKARGEKEAEKTQGIGVQLRAIYGISIPVIIRNGNTKSTVLFSETTFKPVSDSTGIINTTINRGGNESIYGDIIAEFINHKFESKTIGQIKGLGVYTSTNKRRVAFSVKSGNGIDIKNGKVRLRYVINKDNEQKIMTEQIVVIK